MDEILKPGYKTSSFARGIAVDGAWVLLAFQSDDWRVQCVAMLAVAATNVSYNFYSARRLDQKKEVAIAVTTNTPSNGGEVKPTPTDQ